MRAEDLSHKESLREFVGLDLYLLQERWQRGDTSTLYKHKCYADIKMKQPRAPKGIEARN